jgi:hypothetical protein
MSEDRPIRDALGEMMRRERIGLARPLWNKAHEDDREPYRQRADHLIRLLAEAGLAVVRISDPHPDVPPPSSPIIWRCKIADRNAERLLRRAEGDLWEIVTIENGQETVEQSFTLQHASINGGRVLTGAPEARKIPGLGSQLAAVMEIYRLDAVAMEPTA